jgi:hypothetical protein
VDALGQRRPKRNRVPPSKYWENERVVYKPRPSGGTAQP